MAGLFAALLALSPGLAAAEDVSGQSSTYLTLREDLFGENVGQLYEYLNLNVGGIKGRDISLHLDGWIRQSVTDEYGTSNSFEQELRYGYGRFGSTYGKTRVDAGRVVVFEGVASEQIDGAYARLGKVLGLAVFGGVPVETDFDDRDGDIVYGARLFRDKPGSYSVGVSYLQEENDSRDFREEMGVDLWFNLFGKANIQGLSSYNGITNDWMEHSYYLSLGPIWDLRVNAEFSYIDYENFFQSATMSAFSFDNIDRNEKLAMAGVSANYQFTGEVLGSALYRNYQYDVAGSADYFGGELRFLVTGLAAGASFYRMSGETDDLQYYQYRVFASKRVGMADVTVDLLDVDYDAPINGEDNAFNVVGAVAYALSPKYTVGADVEYSENPFFDEEVKAFLKFIYRFSKGA